MAFRDVLELTVQGGKGGDGGLSFLRLKYMPKGGPDGGHGGDGGSVLLEAISEVTSLDRLVSRRQYKAGTGAQGEGRDKAGVSGADLTLQVPVGTLAFDAETGELLTDLTEVGQRAVLARGGSGGRGNASFASARSRTPRFAEKGTPGEKHQVRLELRTVADVGLVGYPNAGKSSLLAALSNAKPRIADYAFTTLSPNLGVVIGELQRLTIADIPGIIEGAHEGKGLGLEFLRHISRTRLLVYVLDLTDAPAETLRSLQTELTAYDPALLERPALVVANKADLLEGAEGEQAVAELTRAGLPTLAVSALSGQGLPLLRRTLFELLPARPAPLPEAPAPTRVKVEMPRVERDMSGKGWVVRSAELEATVARFDATNREAVAYLQHHFKAAGVYRLLEKAGAEDGDEVRIGEAEFEYFAEDKGETGGSEEAV